MRIKLTANSNVSLPAHLANIELDYGYTLLGNNSVNDWTVKIASGIDKALSFFKPLSSEQKEFIQSVTESAKFLDSHIPESDSRIDNLQIQLNIKTPLNQGILTIAQLIGEFSKYVKPTFKDKAIKKANNLGMMANPHLGIINSKEKIMYLGSEIFKGNPEYSSATYMQDNLGMQRFANLAVYHEASHSFESTNFKNFGDKFAPIFREINDSSTYFSHIDDMRKSLNKQLEDNKDLGLTPLYPTYIKNISILYKEIYADVGSILLQRNQDIIEGKHSRETDLLTINTMISARNKEQEYFDKKVMSSDYPSGFDHFTSVGLEYLRDRCYQLPKKVLTQEEIHTITHQAVEQGVSRILIASSFANKNYTDDLKTIFNTKIEMEPNDSISFSLPYKTNPDFYIKCMHELKKYAGEEWFKQFIDNTNLIHEQNMDDKKKATWHAAFFPKRFKEDLENDAALKAQNNELFGIKQKNSAVITPKVEEQVGIISQENVELRVGNLIDKFRKPQPTNSTKPNFH
jgi:hypothetical protein